MSGEVPRGWTRTSLGVVASNVSDRWEPSEGAQAYIGLEHIDQGTGYLLGRGDTSQLQSIKTHFRPGDTLFGKLRPNLRKTALVDFAGVASTDILVIRPLGKLIPEFLFYRLSSEEVFDHAIRSSAGTKMPRTSWKEIGEFEFPLPPLPEQRRIAEILSSVDEAIAATRAVIEQTRKVGSSILQGLFQGNHVPGERKSTAGWKLGNFGAETIPTSWQIVRLTDVARLESGHTPSKKISAYWDGDVNWLSLHDTKNLKSRFIFNTVQNTTPLGVENSSARLLPAGTVCFSRTASIGHCVILGRRMATSQDFANYICSDKLSNKFLMYLFREMAELWAQLSSGSTHKTIYMPIFEQIQIALPSLDQQLKVVEVADGIYDRVDINEQELHRLQILKSALMSDLLTGRKRVTDTLPLAAE